MLILWANCQDGAMDKRRTYERTHPWITFRLDTRKAKPTLWMALGEAQSKCEHIAGVPLRPATQRELHQLFLAKGALATTAIEGNTLTEAEVRKHLEGKLELPPSREYLRQEIDNILTALQQIWNSETQQPSNGRITPEEVRQFNKLVLDKLEVAEEVVPGEPRSHEVGVGHYQGAPAGDCQHLLDRLCEWLNGTDFTPVRGLEIVYALLKAIIAHLYIAWIHPFGDGNGRTARLVEFKILVAAGVPTPAAHLLSNHYNQTRQEYYRQLDNASRSSDGVLEFVSYAVQGFTDGLRYELDLIREQQQDVAWRNYVHEECAKEQNERVRTRRRHLVLDLSSRREPVPLAGISQLSARVARDYAAVSTKTLSRDLDALEQEKLVLKTKAGYSANKNLILAFLPSRAAASTPEPEVRNE